MADLKSAIDRWRGLPPEATKERTGLAETIRQQAEALDLITADTDWGPTGDGAVPALADRLREFELSLIPHGLHVVGEIPDEAERADLLRAVNSAAGDASLSETELLEVLETPASAKPARRPPKQLAGCVVSMPT